MPVQIDELSAEVEVPSPGSGRSAGVTERPARKLDPEALRRELERLAERERRLMAD